jgi:hypothetical protein
MNQEHIFCGNEVMKSYSCENHETFIVHLTTGEKVKLKKHLEIYDDCDGINEFIRAAINEKMVSDQTKNCS